MISKLVSLFNRVSPRFLAISWTLIIVALCSIPGQDLPEIDIIGIDKLVHLAMFAIFGLLWLRTSETLNIRTGVSIILAGILFGIGTEIYQEFLDIGRLMDPYDAIANSIGVTGAVLTRLSGVNR